MFTANTMSSIAEAIGMSLPGSASPPAIDARREVDARRAGEAVVNQLRLGITPRQIMTKPAFENAIALTSALGGSTNAVLHLLAIANEAGVALELDDFNRIADRVPHIADMTPGGKFHMSDLDKVGGVPMVLKHLLDHGMLNGDCMTVTGKTMAENLAEMDLPGPDGVVVHPIDAPIHSEGGINILTGSLAPLGSVVKVAGLSAEQMHFEGPARVFDDESYAMEAILAGEINAGDVIVIRYEGPKGGPGMREMLAITGALKGARARRRLCADHRRPVLRWHVGLLYRPRRSRGDRRGTHRVRRGGRHDPHRRAVEDARSARGRRHARGSQGGLAAERTALHERRARQVRPPRARCRNRRHHQHPLKMFVGARHRRTFSGSVTRGCREDGRRIRRRSAPRRCRRSGSPRHRGAPGCCGSRTRRSARWSRRARSRRLRCWRPGGS